MSSLLLSVNVGSCPLAVLQPQTADAVLLSTEQGALSRGSLLRLRSTEECGAMVSAELLSSVYFYQEKGADIVGHGESVCLDIGDVQPAEDFAIYTLVSPPGKRGGSQGQIWRELHDPADCQAEVLQFAKGEVLLSDLQWGYAVTSQRAMEIQRIQDSWRMVFGDWARGRVWLNDWGYLALPLEYYTAEQVNAEYSRENLVTDEQREKAVVAAGPDGLWLHFLGSDALYSDVWGAPKTISTLISVYEKWGKLCVDDQLGSPASCVPQVGDIAWYNPKQPDPLGHRHHYSGGCIDLRLFRSDASRYESYWNREDDRDGFTNSYDSATTNAFIDLLIAEGAEEILFSDPQSNAKIAARHNDHVHFCFSK